MAGQRECEMRVEINNGIMAQRAGKGDVRCRRGLGVELLGKLEEHLRTRPCNQTGPRL